MHGGPQARDSAADSNRTDVTPRFPPRPRESVSCSRALLRAHVNHDPNGGHALRVKTRNIRICETKPFAADLHPPRSTHPTIASPSPYGQAIFRDADRFTPEASMAVTATDVLRA